jgi:predicted metal-dependent hydrolase
LFNIKAVAVIFDYPKAYMDYLIYFHAERDFFECHEVLEAYWKEHPGDPLATAYVGLIQVAVSFYHQRRHNLAGALKMLRSAIHLLKVEDLVKLGIDPALFHNLLLDCLERLENPADFKYADMDIPLADPLLQAACMERCVGQSLVWQSASNFGDIHLINKHTLRDRSSVIEERERSRQMKLAAKRDQDE